MLESLFISSKEKTSQSHLLAMSSFVSSNMLRRMSQKSAQRFQQSKARSLTTSNHSTAGLLSAVARTSAAQQNLILPNGLSTELAERRRFKSTAVEVEEEEEDVSMKLHLDVAPDTNPTDFVQDFTSNKASTKR